MILKLFKDLNMLSEDTVTKSSSKNCSLLFITFMCVAYLLFSETNVTEKLVRKIMSGSLKRKQISDPYLNQTNAAVQSYFISKEHLGSCHF